MCVFACREIERVCVRTYLLVREIEKECVRVCAYSCERESLQLNYERN